MKNKSLNFNYDQYVMLGVCNNFAKSQVNQPITDLIPEFSSGIDDVEAKINLITPLLAEQAENTTGTTATKNKYKLGLALALLAVTNPVAGYLAKTGDVELRKSIKKSKSAYLRMTPTLLISEAERIVEIITPMLPSIVTTGVIASSLTAITTAKTKLVPYTEKPRNKRVQKTQHLKKMIKLLKEAMAITTEQLDPLSTGFTSIAEDSYLEGWQQSRRLVTYGTFHTRASIDVFMGDANAPVDHAICRVENTPIQGVTNDAGHVNVPYIPFDQEHYIIVTAPGFPNPVRSGPYYFKKGKSTHITVNMTEFSVPAPVTSNSNVNA